MALLKRACIASLLLAATLGIAKPITIHDYRALVVPSNPQVSPDGNWVAFVKKVHNFANDVDEASIVTLNISTGATYTASGKNLDASSPRWSPDGTRIAFLRTNADSIAQIYVVPFRGGDVSQITHASNGVQQFAWSPNGSTIAYVSQDDDPNQAALRRHDDLFQMGDDGFLTASRPLPSHIWLVPAGGGTPKRLTHGAWSVMENPPPFAGNPTDPSWSPDGKWITFARQANSDNSDTDLSQVAAVNVATGQTKLLSDRTNYEYDPAFSPRSNLIAYLRPHDAPLGVMDLSITSPSNSNDDWSPSLSRDITSFTWMPDGKGALVGGNQALLNTVWLQKPNSPAAELKLGGLNVTDIAAGGKNTIAVVGSTYNRPPEVYVLDGPDANPKQLTHFNDSFENFEFAKTGGLVSVGDGSEISTNLLTFPLHYEQGHKYPLLVFIHGGPEAAATNQFLQNEGGLLRQTMAAKGYFVFEPNYRGSDNDGQAHEQAIFKNPGEGPASDVLAGITELEKEGYIDTSRISIAGHSYGGYMTTWLISHDHRWKSAVVLDGAVDWTMEYSFSSDGNLAWVRDSLGGSPWDPASADLYRTGSPITYAGDISTPTLIISGTADQTVPITESFELYHALKDNKVPVKFVAIPGAHHMPQDPVKYERMWEITEDWLLEHD